MQLNYHRVGAGPSLVLIHGIGSHWQVWAPVLDRLAAQRDVIAIDLPGFGESPMPPPGTPPGAASLAGLVSSFLDELGVERPHVAGNSLGGWVSLELALTGRAKSATALSPAGFHTAREAVYQRALLRSARASSRLVVPVADQLMKPALSRTITMGLFFARPARIAPAAAASAWRALAGAPWFDETLVAITSTPFQRRGAASVPVTVAWAEKDRLLLPRQAPRAARAIPGARLLTLPGCGHVPTFDDPHQVAQVLLDGSRH